MRLLFNKFKKITYKVTGYDIAASSEATNFTVGKIKVAVKQAFGIWAAYAPLLFEEVNTANADITIGFRNWGNPSAELGITAGKSIDINTANKHFIDKQFEKEVPPNSLIGPFDLVWILAHEIGHALGFDHPPIVNNMESPTGTLMSWLISEGAIRRQLTKYEIDNIKAKYGLITNIDVISTNFTAFADVTSSFTGMHYIEDDSFLQIDGPVNNSASLNIFLPNTKNRKVSAINLKFTTYLANTVFRSIQFFDGIIPIQDYYLNAAIPKGSSTAFKEWDYKLGFLEKKKLKNGILAKLNIEFIDIERNWDVGVFQLKSITADGLEEFAVELPEYKSIPIKFTP